MDFSWVGDLDTARFWKDDEAAQRDNCFFPGPQVALGIGMSDECVFAELGEEGTPWAPIPLPRRAELNRRYNDRAERLVGRRLLREDLPPEDAAFPPVRRIGEIFGGAYFYQNDTEWLGENPKMADDRGLEEELCRIEKLDVASLLFPPGWRGEKRRIFETYGLRPQPVRSIRGPVTLACSLLGAERLIYLLLDAPELGARLSRAIADVALKIGRATDEEAGVTALSLPGYAFNDDNCCLLSPELYRLFGFPVLQAVFSHYSPRPGDMRYQHSDSAMGHLLPLLGQLGLTGVNFGPTVLIPQIREHLPSARIDGCIAPFTFMRGDREALFRETLRDCRDGLEHGGVRLSTAGSINNGSSLESLRLVMATIQRHGRRGG